MPTGFLDTKTCHIEFIAPAGEAGRSILCQLVPQIHHSSGGEGNNEALSLASGVVGSGFTT